MSRTLDPESQVLLNAAAASGLPPVYQVEIEEARRRMHAGFTSGEPEPIASVRDLRVAGPGGGLGLRLYTPVAEAVVLPCLLFFHGGGWTVNDLDTHDRLCSLIAKGAGIAVLSVDTRRAPEHKYPAAVEDAFTALLYLTSHGAELGVDTNKLAVGGDSSGGTVATALCLLNRDRETGIGLRGQVLLYPVTDYPEPESSSYAERGTGYSLDRGFMEWSWRNYLPEKGWSRDDPYLFPLQAQDLHNLPPALIMTAEFDPLRDEGVAYVRRLTEAGVPVRHEHLDNQMHGFAMQTRVIDNARAAVEDVGIYLRGVLGGLS